MAIASNQDNNNISRTTPSTTIDLVDCRLLRTTNNDIPVSLDVEKSGGGAVGGSPHTTSFSTSSSDAAILLQPVAKGGVACPFPWKLHEMLDAVEKEGLTSIVSWQPHGRSFTVYKPKEFVSKVLTRFFQQTKWPSFQRQLNLYGFSRFAHGRDKGAYYHSHFLRGKPSAVGGMVRRKVKGTKVRRTFAPEDEPNFYDAAWKNVTDPVPVSPDDYASSAAAAAKKAARVVVVDANNGETEKPPPTSANNIGNNDCACCARCSCVMTFPRNSNPPPPVVVPVKKNETTQQSHNLAKAIADIRARQGELMLNISAAVAAAAVSEGEEEESTAAVSSSSSSGAGGILPPTTTTTTGALEHPIVSGSDDVNGSSFSSLDGDGAWSSWETLNDFDEIAPAKQEFTDDENDLLEFDYSPLHFFDDDEKQQPSGNVDAAAASSVSSIVPCGQFGWSQTENYIVSV